MMTKLMEKYKKKKLYRYSKMDKEDAKETKHRRAQFLSNKVLHKYDSSSSRTRPCLVRIRLPKFIKIKIISNRFNRIKKKLKRLVLGSSHHRHHQD
ncbi:hypothetical protein K1719_028045 [Acacia pycnantha]|nr:hypothetical protein K1719_028045 [Acacia pycnantha]